MKTAVLPVRHLRQHENCSATEFSNMKTAMVPSSATRERENDTQWPE
jgi:hypothetical protein